ncbi:MAG: glycine/sarcosine/betaine reductase selenoprotein B family protein [Planctomycetota bacterium]
MPLPVPLSQARIALVSSGGISQTGQPPFRTGPLGDASIRVIARDADPDQLVFSHPHYDTSLGREDKEVIFPIATLKRLASAGVIGAVAPELPSMMGYIPRSSQLAEITAPSVLEVLQRGHVHAALFAPA